MRPVRVVAGFVVLVWLASLAGIGPASAGARPVPPGDQPPTRAISGNQVVNGSGATGTQGWSAHSAAGPVTVKRFTRPAGAPADGSTAIEVSRAGGRGTWGFAMSALAAPQTVFKIGRTYRMQAWVRSPAPAGQRISMLLADGGYRNRPTDVDTTFTPTDTAWHLISRTFVCTAEASAATALYFKIPDSGAFTFQITGATLHAVVAPQPPTVPTLPTRIITFPGSKGSPPDPAMWRAETGGNGWGNNELQAYTANTANAQVDGNGRLEITARQENHRGADLIARQFTSARLTTEGKVVVPAGSYVEATITAPTGAGAWPAFWLVGADVSTVGWPAAGELDVLEGWGAQPTVAHSAIHLSALTNPQTHVQYGWNEPGGTTDIGERLNARPHLYGVYFDGQLVRFYLDRKPTMTVWAEDAALAGAAWPFHKPQHMLLNIAVPNGTKVPALGFPKTMVVIDITVWNGGVPFS